MSFEGAPSTMDVVFCQKIFFCGAEKYINKIKCSKQYPFIHFFLVKFATDIITLLLSIIDYRQFGKRLRCVILVAANVALSCY